MSYPRGSYYREERVLMSTTTEVAQCPGSCHTKNCLVASTGGLQIIIGIVSIVFGTVVVMEEYGTDKTPVGMPIWAGALYFLTGIIGITTLCIGTGCLLTTYMVMSLLSCVLAVTQIIWETIAATIHYDEFDKCNYPIDGSTFDCFNRLAEYMHIGGAVVAGIEIIVGTCAWIFACCRGGCDCTPKEEIVVVSRPRRRPQPPRENRRVNSNVIFIP